jgi:hypothetical protein
MKSMDGQSLQQDLLELRSWHAKVAGILELLRQPLKTLTKLEDDEPAGWEEHAAGAFHATGQALKEHIEWADGPDGVQSPNCSLADLVALCEGATGKNLYKLAEDEWVKEEAEFERWLYAFVFARLGDVLGRL